MASIFEPGKATSTTVQPASPAKREAVLSILQALAGSGREIGGYGGKRGKPGLSLDLGNLIQLIQSDPTALDRRVLQSGRPSSPSTFQNLASGLTTALLLGKVLTDKDDTGANLLGRILGAFGDGADSSGGSLGVLESDAGGGTLDWLSGLSSGSSDGTYGVNQSDAGLDAASLMEWLGY